MILLPDKSCIRPISFYRVPNAFNRVNNAKRREMILKKEREIFRKQIFALLMLILGYIIGKCFIVE